LLSILIWVPVIVAVSLAFLPNPRGRYDALVKQIAFFTNLGTLGLLMIGYSQFENFLPTMQYEEKIPWLPSIGVPYHLGVDGPGIAMLVLSGFIGVVSVLASWGVRERVRSYFSLLLLAQASVTGAIVARDMFVLVLFWGASIIPLALLLIGWGGHRRVPAAWRLVGYWGLGTGALAVGTLALYSASGGTSFDMDALLKSTLSSRVQLGVGALMIVAAATRLPLFPLHGWARDVLGEAPPGVVAALIACICATVAERAQTRSLAVLGGLAPRMPNATWLFVIAALSLLGIPLMASFAANVMTFFGAFKTQPIGAFAVAAGLAV